MVNAFPFGRLILILENKGLPIVYTGIPGVIG